MELQQLINQLEHVISQGKRVPLSQSIMVDEEAMRRVIDQMRVSVPDMIKQAERTVGERDRIVAQANEEASRIIQMAREQATDMVEHHELTEAARKRANELSDRGRAPGSQHAVRGGQIRHEFARRPGRPTD